MKSFYDEPGHVHRNLAKDKKTWKSGFWVIQLYFWIKLKNSRRVPYLSFLCITTSIAIRHIWQNETFQRLFTAWVHFFLQNPKWLNKILTFATLTDFRIYYLDIRKIHIFEKNFDAKMYSKKRFITVESYARNVWKIDSSNKNFIVNRIKRFYFENFVF